MTSVPAIRQANTSSWPTPPVMEVSAMFGGDNAGGPVAPYPEYELWIQSQFGAVSLGGPGITYGNGYLLASGGEFHVTVPAGAEFYLVAETGQTPLINLLAVIR